MEELQKTADLLKSVVSTMDTISIVGLENMDRFLGCANAAQAARKLILDQVNAPVAEEIEDAG